ncbi:Putative flippase GtrA (transmembrane translocase of bactoprenol-linked glucose) [Quadrisphaera granulorum]|uniref:Putative flippase GtrA n=1 Tax=Quadrisphaera granulorum TaxID=317664 RepID=A0A316ACL2_9ACTN|nr:GtrA family protein [Quadrisphaera granulorum]PWJ55149.1 putative flippase GtrA [Quadrisphaera granulorum]SZE95658.1 Putative flippase GtrA (transmembrane translocase of bactoprenol-linked glucose) [Quadrisphaera granulorum]
MDVQRAEALGPRTARDLARVASALAQISRDPRARFLVVGAGSTAVHLAVMSAVLPLVLAEGANAIAFVVATQVNFTASYCWTWASRRTGREGPAHLARRLALFNAAALLGFGVNSACFSAAHRLLDASPVLSALLATAVSAVVSFAVTSRLVFAQRAQRSVVTGVSRVPTGVSVGVSSRVSVPADAPVLVLIPAPRSAHRSEQLLTAPSSLPVYACASGQVLTAP